MSTCRQNIKSTTFILCLEIDLYFLQNLWIYNIKSNSIGELFIYVLSKQFDKKNPIYLISAYNNGGISCLPPIIL